MDYGVYRNGIIKIEPKDFYDLCRNWIDPDTGQTIGGLENRSPEELKAKGIFPALTIVPAYDANYEEVIIGPWAFNAAYLRFERADSKQDRNLEIVRGERLSAVRKACSDGILAILDYPHQLNLANGLIPDLGYTNFIAAMIAESNRCEDLYTSANTINDLKAVVWNFPAYIAP